MRPVTVLPLLLAVASARIVNFNRRADNLQTFTGDLGGAAPAVTNSGDSTRPFEVNGDTFVNEAGALQRSCDVQFNTCANQANGGASFSVAQCQQQEDQCNAAAGAAKRSIEERSEHITPRFPQIQVRANSNSTGNNDQASRVGNIKRKVDFEKRNGTAADFIKRGDIIDKRNDAAQNGHANFIKRFTSDMEKRAGNGTDAAQKFGQAAKEIGGIVQGIGNLLGGGGGAAAGGAGNKASAPFGLKPRKTHFFRS
ncbi:hypothetical protein C8Q69DRAFT_302314 [Paecilomyces variotii]|uniref:Uncharacterized protein n=1 Tax=Byssochlamys spectabilis TaxID=264951 RepID=A0A443HSC0_BYSSP|nr:hypothetical protein C8Q69DRAFT_302314 [Paecilomyces variotii]KAJ9303403.1 hypothetical protein DTO217A2_7098 [Paecilomyces variotii]KAJ9356731.1 hypothetical protein DTO280E4_5922 [Paecilomyces variotii]KAJ9367861.1 hypothetical protein DTO282E5_7462 [Paecilomyces variotii]RWQ94726.1 hypothetical protein C8Q69DRAFT_302314 [Paecilomyces variotii]